MPPISVSARPARARATLSTLVVLAALTSLAPVALAPSATAAPATSSRSDREVRHLRPTTVEVSTRAHRHGIRVVARVRVENPGGTAQPATQARLWLTQDSRRVYRLGATAVPRIGADAFARLRSAHMVRSRVAPGRYAVQACVEVVGRNACISSRADAVVVGPARLTLTPGSGDVGDVRVGETSRTLRFVLANTGTAGARRTRVVLDGAGRDQFAVLTDRCSGRTIPRGRTCEVEVAMRPTVAGPAVARLAVVTHRGTAEADLSGTGVVTQASPAELRVTPVPAFPDTVAGQRSAPLTVGVTNAGGSPSGTPSVSVTGPGRDQFTLTHTTCDNALAPGASCLATLTFDPTTGGTAAADLSVAASPGGTVTTPLSGRALAAAALTLSPDVDAFPATLVGDVSGPVELTLTNTGEVATGPVSMTLDGADADQFGVAGSTCTGPLAPSQSCLVSLAFDPSTRGAKSVRVVASGTPGGTADVTLSGLGLAPAALVISPADGPFPTTVTGDQSGPVDLTVTNTGDVATGTLATGLGGADADQFTLSATTCADALAPGGTCTVSVAFTPSSRGTKAADVLVGGSPGGVAATGLTGQALAAAALTFVDQPSFPDTTTLDHSAPLDFTVVNEGDVATGDLTVSLTDDQVTEFTIVGTTCTTLAPAATCTVSVTFDPKLRGWTNRALRITALEVTAEGASTARVGVYGYALPVPAHLVITPTTWTFPATAAGSRSPSQRFTITNVGDLSTGLMRGGSFSGPDWGQFTRMVDACYSSLGYLETCYIDVALTPLNGTVKGTKNADLNVSASPGGTASAHVSGDSVYRAFAQPTPSTTSFGGVLIGERSASSSITFTNTGDVPTEPLAATLTGTDASQYAIDHDGCTGVVLAAAQSCVVSAYFAPTGRGSKRASISVSANAFPANLLGNGQAPASLTLTPGSLAFATTPVGQVSTTLTVTVTNVGDVTSGVVTTTLGGSDADQFAQTATTCGITLGASRTCKVTYRFAPTSTGPKTATVTASGAPVANDAVLSGTGG